MRNRKDGIARYVGEIRQYQGWIFRCVSSYEYQGQAAWTVDPPCPHPTVPGKFAKGICDAALEPLGNPGENEVDVHDVLLGQRSAA